MNRTLKTSLSLLALLTLLVEAPAFAQRRIGPRMHRGTFVFVGGYFYDPFFGPYPWWDRGVYPYGYGYGYEPVYDESAGVRIEVTPKEAGVYVDGYYAGIVDDFDGFFQRLTLSPGQHDLTLYLDGYRTVHQPLRLSPRSTFKVGYRMERLAVGETSEKPALAPALPAPPPGSYMAPRTPPRTPFPPGPAGPPPVRGVPPAAPPSAAPSVRGAPPSAAPRAEASVGTIVVRVQPGGADVFIDGERWTSSDTERLTVQVSDGRHHVEVRKSGYRTLAIDVDVRGNATVPLNVSLSPE